MRSRWRVTFAEADTLPVNGHRNVLVLVCVDSDDHLNIAITFATGNSYHCYLLGDDAAVGTPAR